LFKKRSSSHAGGKLSIGYTEIFFLRLKFRSEEHSAILTIGCYDITAFLKGQSLKTSARTDGEIVPGYLVRKCQRRVTDFYCQFVSHKTIFQ